MLIRTALAGDLPGIFAIYDREVLHGTCTFDTRPRSDAERLEWFYANAGERYPIVVAVDDEPDVGFGKNLPRLEDSPPPPPGRRGMNEPAASMSERIAGPRIAGWARLYPWSPRPAYARTAENAVYVDEGWRGRGVGRGLLLEVLRRGYDAGVRVVIARIAEGNPGSVALHEKLGFRAAGTLHRVGEKFGIVRDVLMMERGMDAGRP